MMFEHLPPISLSKLTVEDRTSLKITSLSGKRTINTANDNTLPFSVISKFSELFPLYKLKTAVNKD